MVLMAKLIPWGSLLWQFTLFWELLIMNFTSSRFPGTMLRLLSQTASVKLVLCLDLVDLTTRPLVTWSTKPSLHPSRLWSMSLSVLPRRQITVFEVHVEVKDIVNESEIKEEGASDSCRSRCSISAVLSICICSLVIVYLTQNRLLLEVSSRGKIGVRQKYKQRWSACRSGFSCSSDLFRRWCFKYTLKCIFLLSLFL